MTENTSQDNEGGHVIRTAADLTEALTNQFLTSAAADDNEANDDFVLELIEWKRANQ